MINLRWRTWLQNFITLHFSSKPEHRWAEGGKELNEMWHIIINDVGQNYNYKPHYTDKLATLVKRAT
jgi:hypothetical protein